MGSGEEGSKRIDNWKNYTLASFESEIVDGGHFFIHHHAAKITSVIKDIFFHKTNLI
jgi:surfactin synthase thioesterase subunit